MHTCRFCKETEFDPKMLVQYGVRHHAHWECYSKSGRGFDKLSKFQLGRTPLWFMRNNPKTAKEIRALLEGVAA